MAIISTTPNQYVVDELKAWVSNFSKSERGLSPSDVEKLNDFIQNKVIPTLQRDQQFPPLKPAPKPPSYPPQAIRVKKAVERIVEKLSPDYYPTVPQKAKLQIVATGLEALGQNHHSLAKAIRAHDVEEMDEEDVEVKRSSEETLQEISTLEEVFNDFHQLAKKQNEGFLQMHAGKYVEPSSKEKLELKTNMDKFNALIAKRDELHGSFKESRRRSDLMKEKNAKICIYSKYCEWYLDYSSFLSNEWSHLREISRGIAELDAQVKTKKGKYKQKLQQEKGGVELRKDLEELVKWYNTYAEKVKPFIRGYPEMIQKLNDSLNRDEMMLGSSKDAGLISNPDLRSTVLKELELPLEEISTQVESVLNELDKLWKGLRDNFNTLELEIIRFGDAIQKNSPLPNKTLFPDNNENKGLLQRVGSAILWGFSEQPQKLVHSPFKKVVDIDDEAKLDS